MSSKISRERPDYEYVNSRIALNHGVWEVALLGKNLTDEHANFFDDHSIAAETEDVRG